jgi:hypothetical protein
MIDAMTHSKIALYFRAQQQENEVIAEFLQGQDGAVRGVNLTDDDVMEFKRIYERTTGQHIEMDAAREKATKLVAFVHALLQLSNVVDGDA